MTRSAVTETDSLVSGYVSLQNRERFRAAGKRMSAAPLRDRSAPRFALPGSSNSIWRLAPLGPMRDRFRDGGMASKVEASETREELAAAPLLDPVAAVIEKLLVRGRERGYLTADELNAALPPDQVSS